MALNLKLFTTNFKLSTRTTSYESPQEVLSERRNFQAKLLFFAIMLSRRVEMW